tara:strand:- start:301 stop:417 length:117 start_codon:yes stop_codon:yes gene_type:complete
MSSSVISNQIVYDADEEFTKITVFVFFVIFTMVFFVIL